MFSYNSPHLQCTFKVKNTAWHNYQQILEREKALAFLVKVKARTHKANPALFSCIGQLLVAFKSTVRKLCLPSSGDHQDTRVRYEVDNLSRAITTLLAHDRQLVVDFQCYLRRNYASSAKSLVPVHFRSPDGLVYHHGYVTTRDRHPRHRVADLVEKARVFCEGGCEGGGQERYEKCMKTMEEYLEDVIDYREFMRRILSLDRDGGLRRDFISQFCADVELS